MVQLKILNIFLVNQSQGLENYAKGLITAHPFRFRLNYISILQLRSSDQITLLRLNSNNFAQSSHSVSSFSQSGWSWMFCLGNYQIHLPFTGILHKTGEYITQSHHQRS